MPSKPKKAVAESVSCDSFCHFTIPPQNNAFGYYISIFKISKHVV